MIKRTLKEHRAVQHLSQQDLADRSGISLRTVQRIEKNESAGSPYVIRALCKALDIETDSLLLETGGNAGKDLSGEEERAANGNGTVQEETPQKAPVNKYLKLINLSAMSALLLPFSNLVVATVLYLVFRKRLTAQTDTLAVFKILSFQVLWSSLTLILLIFTPLVDDRFLHIGETLEIPLFLWVYLVLLFSHLLITLTAAVRLNRDEDPMPYVPNIF